MGVHNEPGSGPLKPTSMECLLGILVAEGPLAALVSTAREDNGLSPRRLRPPARAAYSTAAPPY